MGAAFVKLGRDNYVCDHHTKSPILDRPCIRVDVGIQGRLRKTGDGLTYCSAANDRLSKLKQAVRPRSSKSAEPTRGNNSCLTSRVRPSGSLSEGLEELLVLRPDHGDVEVRSTPTCFVS